MRCDELIGLFGSFRRGDGCAVFAQGDFVRREFSLRNASSDRWGASYDSWREPHEVQAESCQRHTAVYIRPVVEPAAGLVVVIAMGQERELE